MTKRLTIFVALLAAGFSAWSGSVQAQNYKVLIEEFTSSTCPPCAVTDPIMKQVESEKFNDICVLKWHQNFPAAGDPSYVMYTPGQNRLGYYNVAGIPGIALNGNKYFNPGYGVAYIEDSIANCKAAMTNYFTMSSSQTIVGDSIIAYVTVKTGATPPVAADLRLAAVVAERFSQYRGSNGLPSHDYIARWTMPALDSKGGLPVAAAFTQLPNTTQIYRFSAAIKSTWNREQLMVVSFIQSYGSPSNTTKKEIFQSTWNEPNIDVTAKSSVVVVGDPNGSATYTITNNSSAQQKINVSVKATGLSAYTFTVGGLDANGLLTLAPGASKDVKISATSSGASKISGTFGVFARTVDSIGSGGAVGTAFGKENTVVIVDAGATAFLESSPSPANVQASLARLGVTAGILPASAMKESFSDWTRFQAVFWDAGYKTGIYSDNGDTSAVSNYIRHGGKFVFSSNVMANAYSTAGLSEFLESNFKVDAGAYDNANGWTTLTGVAGDPVGDGVTSGIASQVVTQTLISFDNNAHPMFTNDNGDTVGTRATIGSAKSVFLAFELGNVSNTDGKLDTVVSRLFKWLTGTAGVEGSSMEAAGLTVSQNPFSTSTNVSYVGKATESGVQMSLVDILGREVAKLTPVRAGSSYTAQVVGTNLATGSYHVVVRSSEGTHQLPVMITR
jgi:thiol-disulfide isomerase/thioredoxin